MKRIFLIIFLFKLINLNSQNINARFVLNSDYAEFKGKLGNDLITMII